MNVPSISNSCLWTLWVSIWIGYTSEQCLQNIYLRGKVFYNNLATAPHGKFCLRNFLEKNYKPKYLTFQLSAFFCHKPTQPDLDKNGIFIFDNLSLMNKNTIHKLKMFFQSLLTLPPTANQILWLPRPPQDSKRGVISEPIFL